MLLTERSEVRPATALEFVRDGGVLGVFVGHEVDVDRRTMLRTARWSDGAVPVAKIGNVQIGLSGWLVEFIHVEAVDGDWPVDLSALRDLDHEALRGFAELATSSLSATEGSSFGTTIRSGQLSVHLNAAGHFEALGLTTR